MVLAGETYGRALTRTEARAADGVVGCDRATYALLERTAAAFGNVDVDVEGLAQLALRFKDSFVAYGPVEY